MKINKGEPFWPFKHSAVIEKFQGTRFVNEFCLKTTDGRWSEQPVAVYFSENPDRSLGHKDYFFLFHRYSFSESPIMMIGGMDKVDMEKLRYQEALHCPDCDEVIYSKFRHDYHPCSCGSVAIDGGRDYTRVIFDKNSRSKHVFIDLLTDEILEELPDGYREQKETS